MPYQTANLHGIQTCVSPRVTECDVYYSARLFFWKDNGVLLNGGYSIYVHYHQVVNTPEYNSSVFLR